MSDANDKKSVGTLRALRLAAGLSQEALARKADCSTAYVRVLEGGYVPADSTSPAYVRVWACLDAQSAGDAPEGS